ncbi:iron ABC transporter ATP-binding protein [Escherichia coli]|uniref:Iron ABC transporter ATP-binding protein n=1 Tax=Escherichia coli TaxID=562 RepID=A0A376RKU1_ECOLX|nr:iron ABC transporter ATP-binding protein [Escherichia coli]
MMQSAGIVVNDVTVTWRNGHTALRDAFFTVPSGSIAALVGVNGSGKSTLFKAIMGFVRLTSGKISVLGIPTRQALQKNLVAYVPQSEEVDWSFPVLVEDVVMMGRYGHMGMLRIAKRGIVRLSPMRWNVSIWWIFAIDKSASFPVDKRNASFWRERLHSRVM